MHPQLSGRLADFSSVPGYAYQPHSLATYSLGVPRAMCQHAEEHSRPKSVHTISGSMFRLRGDESPPLARSRGDESPPLVRSRGDETPPLARSLGDESPPLVRSRGDESPPLAAILSSLRQSGKAALVS